MAFQDEDEVGGKMSDKKFEGDPLDYTSLFVEARRAREAEKNLDAALSLAHSGIEKLEAEKATYADSYDLLAKQGIELQKENSALKKQIKTLRSRDIRT